MENLKATLEDITEELEVGLQESLEENLESEVTDINESFKYTVELPIHLQKEFTSDIIDFPDKNSSDALSSRGAYNYIPYQLEISKVSENLFKFNFLSRSGDIVGNEVNFQFTKLTEETTPQKLEVVKLNNATYKLNLRNFKGEILGAVQYIKLPEVVDKIEKNNFNAVTSNQAYNLKETLINNLQEINTCLLNIKKSIPTKVGELENDSNFMSNLEVIRLLQEGQYITLSKLNSFNFADKNYIQGIITSINNNFQDINSRINNLVSENSTTNSKINKINTTIQELSSEINNLNSNFNNLQIPTKVSDLENDSNFINEDTLSSKNFVTESLVEESLQELSDNILITIAKEFVSNHQLEQKDYLTRDEINNVINEKGFITETVLNNKGFLKEQDIEGLATEQYINNLVGDINIVLDQINGEVI